VLSINSKYLITQKAFFLKVNLNEKSKYKISNFHFRGKRKMKKEESLFLNQLVNSLEEASEKLGKYYEKRDSENFNKSKKIMLKIQKEISDIIR
jgi:hypothetical protein